MRVKIGRYPHHFDTKDLLYRYLDWRYGVSEWLFFGDDGHDGQPDYDWIDRSVIRTLKGVDWILDKCLNRFIDRSRGPKHKVTVDPHDVVSLDYTLGLVILPALKRFREDNDSIHIVDPVDVPSYLKPSKDELDHYYQTMEIDDKAHARWEWVLDEMIWAFECVVDKSWEDQYHTGNMDIQFERTSNGYCSMVYGPDHTHQFDSKGYEDHSKRIDRGLKLFTKYYRTLWM